MNLVAPWLALFFALFTSVLSLVIVGHVPAIVVVVGRVCPPPPSESLSLLWPVVLPWESLSEFPLGAIFFLFVWMLLFLGC